MKCEKLGDNLRVKIKNYILNKNTNNSESFKTTGIFSKNNIKYKNEDTSYQIKLQKEKVILIRENKNFYNIIEFCENKTKKSIYNVKENNISIEINIKTKNLKIEKNKIEIEYEIIDSKENFIYKIEMEDII